MPLGPDDAVLKKRHEALPAPAPASGATLASLLFVVAVVLLACRSRSNDAPGDAAAPAVTAALDEATVTKMTRDLFDAWDRNDEAPFVSAISASFENLDEQTLRSRDELLALLRKRKARQAPPRTRTWKEQHVTIGEASAVFVGEAVEHYAPDGQRPSGDFDGRDTVVWVREAAGWRAAYWQWIKGGLDAERADWDTTYREGRIFNPEPSKFLVEAVKGRKPGAALDIAMGQGRNAVYLATLGWKVTGIDISPEAIRQARAGADARHVHIDAIEADAKTWDYGVAKWDLVVMTYAGCCDGDRLRTILKPGGLLVAEGFADDTDSAPPPVGEGFTIVTSAMVQDVPDWGSEAGRATVPHKLFRLAVERR